MTVDTQELDENEMRCSSCIAIGVECPDGYRVVKLTCAIDRNHQFVCKAAGCEPRMWQFCPYCGVAFAEEEAVE